MSRHPLCRRLAVLACSGLVAAAWSSAAHAADALLVEKLAPEIGKRCTGGRITANALGEAIYASGVAPLKAEHSWLRGGPQLIAAQAFQNASEDNGNSFRMWRRLFETWTNPGDVAAARYLPLQSGGVSVARINGAAVAPAEAQAVLCSVLEGDDGTYRFSCNAAAPAPDKPPKQEPGRLRIAISRSPDQLALPLDKKKFAQVSYVNNEVKDESSTSIYGTVGFTWGEFSPIRREPGQPGLLVRVIPSAFVQLEREGLSDGDREGEVNNLNFGGQIGGFFQTRGDVTRTHYYAISVRYMTDLDFESKAWSGSFTFTPEIPLPGNDLPYDLIPDTLELEWLVAGVADYMNVVDPGKKTELAESPEFIRIGFDASASLRYLLDASRKQALALSGSYGLREALGRKMGDSHILTASLLFEPAPQYSFGLSFQRGRNLDSLEFTKTWTVTFGIRR